LPRLSHTVAFGRWVEPVAAQQRSVISAWLMIGDGSGRSDRAFAMPWWGRWESYNLSYSRSAWSRCRWFQMRVRSSSSWRQVWIQRSVIEFILGIWKPLSTTLDTGIGEDDVEQGRELAVSVADQESRLAAGVIEVHDEVGLGDPCRDWMWCGAENSDPAVGVFDHGQHVHPGTGQGDRFEEVAGQQDLGR
jgi:hypothetical protein